jgi:hypothetical protein
VVRSRLSRRLALGGGTELRGTVWLGVTVKSREMDRLEHLYLRCSMRALLMILACLGVHPTPGVSQARFLGPAPSALFAAAPSIAVRMARSGEVRDTAARFIRPTYWKRGAAIGGAVGALSGILLGRTICGLSEDPELSCTGTVLVGAIGGALLLAIPGALIGGQFHKPDAESQAH